ncbi:chemotaxis protein CheW [Liquorilactobacillus sicerae]|uniref:chemotaxis protein CheW n=1 Tax=Liquorilactobacillus sicerae TaxID=1416943 RepID=UPI0024815FC6|nr:chemotaxis protein CheW [Liquorilactobacillus sicerae]
MDQYVVFKSHDQYFALPVQVITRIIETDDFISLPDVPDFVLGVFEHQKHMIPIIDLRRKLFNEFTTKSDATKVILCDWQDQHLGLYVENIIGIEHLKETDYEKELTKADLKHDYIGKFLKLKDQVVISLELEFLFDNQQSENLTSTVEKLEKAEENANDDESQTS